MGWVQLGASLYFDHSTLNGSLYIKWVQWVGFNGLDLLGWVQLGILLYVDHSTLNGSNGLGLMGWV